MKSTERIESNRRNLVTLLNLVLEINHAGKYHAFFDFSGHVNGISIRVSTTYEPKEYVLTSHLFLDSRIYKEEEMNRLTEDLEALLPMERKNGKGN